jgi:hypothetical protein
LTHVSDADKVRLHALGVRVQEGETIDSLLNHYSRRAAEQREAINRLTTEKRELAMRLNGRIWWWKLGTFVFAAACVYLIVTQQIGG